MGIGIAIAAIAIAATVTTDVAFTITEEQKQEELKSALKQAQASIKSTNDFYRDVYKIVKTRLEHMKQSMRKLPADVIAKLNEELKLNLNNPDKVIKDIGLVYGYTQDVVNITGLVAGGLTSTGLVAADGVVAEIASIAADASSVLAVVGFGLALYNGITALHKLNDAIDKVNGKRHQAEHAMEKMKSSLDGLLKALGITVGSYESLRDISNDWAQLANNFDQQSTAFYDALIGFAKGMTQSEVLSFLKQRNAVPLKDDVLALALLLEKNILQMMKDGKSDEQVINFYSKDNPKEGLRFVMDPYFVSTLRTFLK